MKLFRKKAPPETITRTEALACIPRPSSSVTWRRLDNGDTLIEYTLNLKPFFVELARKFTKKPEKDLTRKLQLDAMGSVVWQMVDGTNDVKSIIVAVSEESGLTLQESEISVTEFFRELGRRGILHLE